MSIPFEASTAHNVLIKAKLFVISSLLCWTLLSTQRNKNTLYSNANHLVVISCMIEFSNLHVIMVENCTENHILGFNYTCHC